MWHIQNVLDKLAYSVSVDSLSSTFGHGRPPKRILGEEQSLFKDLPPLSAVLRLLYFRRRFRLCIRCVWAWSVCLSVCLSVCMYVCIYDISIHSYTLLKPRWTEWDAICQGQGNIALDWVPGRFMGQNAHRRDQSAEPPPTVGLKRPAEVQYN